MKVLVIDDSTNHQQSARQVLSAEHDLTVVGSYDEAAKLINRPYNWEKDPDFKYWDAVLCDLLMPAGRNAQGPNGMKYVGVEMPVGWSLAIQAAIEGAKYVAVVTDMNHHDHPASAMLDSLNRKIFTINGAKVLMTNYVNLVGITGTEGACPECGGTRKRKSDDGYSYDCYCKDGTGFSQSGKDWARTLRHLVNGKEDDLT